MSEPHNPALFIHPFISRFPLFYSVARALQHTVYGNPPSCSMSCRNIRRDCMKAVDKLKDASEDEQKVLEDAIQELTDEFVKQVDKLVKTKQDELTTV